MNLEFSPHPALFLDLKKLKCFFPNIEFSPPPFVSSAQFIHEKLEIFIIHETLKIDHFQDRISDKKFWNSYFLHEIFQCQILCLKFITFYLKILFSS